VGDDFIFQEAGFRDFPIAAAVGLMPSEFDFNLFQAIHPMV